MGVDKALLPFRDQTLLARALETVGSVSGRVHIVGPMKSYGKFGEVIEDIYQGCGPLAGIHAALCTTGTDLNFVLSVDMPLIPSDFLRWLISQAARSSDLIVVPDALGGQQPLCAVYRRAVQAFAEQALQAGDYKIGHLFSQVPTRFISESEISAAGFSPRIFRNINTVEEYDALVRAETAASEDIPQGGRI